MPPAAVPVTLTAAERKTLKKRVRGARTCWRDRLRAQIVLLAARGWPNARIAGRLEISEITVKIHRGHVMKKMEALSFADLVRMAETLGIKRAN